MMVKMFASDDDDDNVDDMKMLINANNKNWMIIRNSATRIYSCIDISSITQVD